VLSERHRPQASPSRRDVVTEPKSFLVTKDSHLEPNEEARARDWGAGLGSSMDRIALHRVSPG
jgi:hypothetical protein